MVGFPAYCSHCGTLFQSRLIGISPGARIESLTLSGNQETCPNCGRMADVVDGVFNAYDDVLELISGPQFTREILRAFSELIEKAAKQEITEDELQKQAAEIDPDLGKAVAQMRAKTPSAMAALILAMLAIKSCNFDVNVDARIDLNELWHQLTSEPRQEEVYTPSPD